MTMKISPFIEGKYGWDLGESDWNSGVDENFLKFSWLFDGNIDQIVDTLPTPALKGTAYFLNSDKRVYFVADSTYTSTPIAKWFTLKIKSSGKVYIFNGDSLVEYIIDKTSIGLGNVNNTSDANKPISTAQQTALNTKINSSNLASSSGSSLVGFLQDGVGSSTRTLQDKNRDIISVKDFGAKGDGTTDDYASIQAALNYANSSGIFAAVLLPPGSYRVSTGLIIPAGVTLYSEAGGEGYDGTDFTGASEIVGDLSLPVIITLDGQSASSSTNMRRIFVRRAAGTIPASSVGVKVTNTDHCILEDVVVRRNAIGISVTGQLAVSLISCNTTECTDAHLLLQQVVEVTTINTRFGRNGGGDLPASCYVRLTGFVDTISFVRCQFNQSGPFVNGPIFHFSSYNSPNGIITVDDCHAESFDGPLILQDGPGSSSIQRFTLSSSQIHSDATDRELIGALPAGLDQFMMVGNSSIIGKMTFDQQTKLTVANNFIQGVLSINSGSGVVSGNKLYSGLNIAGTFPDGIDHSLVVCGNNLLGSGTVKVTATGNVLCYGNITASASENNQLINKIGGGFIQTQDVAYTVKRLTGTLNASGTVTITLPMSNSNLKVLDASGFYKGGSGEARPMVVSYIDGNSIALTGGTASSRYRVSILYSQDNDVW